MEQPHSSPVLLRPHKLQSLPKLKVDELYTRWFMQDSTQTLLYNTLGKVLSKREKTQVKENGKKVGEREDVLLSVGSASDKSSQTPPHSPRSPRYSNLFSLTSQGTLQPCLSDRRSCTSIKSPRNNIHSPRISLVKDALKNIPDFYFPFGVPPADKDQQRVRADIKAAFSELPKQKADQHTIGEITKAAEVPFYWKMPLFLASGGDKHGYVDYNMFSTLWDRVTESCHDDSSRFVKLLAKPGCNYLTYENFTPMVQDIVDTHPGLAFLGEAKEFHSRYISTVISRIFFCVNRSWTGRITINEIRRSNLLEVLSILEREDDINQVTDYFSYEHFYVIYCKFWELDTDHDLFISKEDLARHNDGAISPRMIERIFSGAVTRGQMQKEGKMSYTEFVWFLIAEEDKRHPTSIEYWFRCMDLDGDGFLSMYEMEYFYEDQLRRMEQLGIVETLPFQDCLCQMLDMVKPKARDFISVSDLKSCKLTPIFFDTFFNLEKYLEHEQRDPFATLRDYDDDGESVSDWDRYAAEEYEALVAEETANEHEQMQDIMQYDDDVGSDDDAGGGGGGGGDPPGLPSAATDDDDDTHSAVKSKEPVTDKV